MSYCNESPRISPQSRIVTLTFKREELLYDVKNYSYVIGDTLGEEAEHGRHQLFDIGEPGNVDRGTRVLNLAHAECVEMLYPYTKEGVAECDAYCDRLKEPNTYYITLDLPRGFSTTTVELLEHLIHEYLVCRVLSDWLSITCPEKQEVWDIKVSQLREKIQASLVSRCGVTKRKCKPF